MVYPANKKAFSLQELQGYVGGIIQIVPLPKGREMVSHEEGKLIGLPKNEQATLFWKETFSLEEYPHNNDQLIVGDVLISGRNLEEILDGGRTCVLETNEPK